MWKILKYTKPYLLMVLFAIGLLYAQANLELALPDYLSDVVDTGIQQGGIENAVPLAIRQTEMERLFIFMSDENETLVLQDYTLIDENSTDYDTNLEKYPALINGSIYVLNEERITAIDDLNIIFKKPVVAVFSLERLLSSPENATVFFEQMGIPVPPVPPEQLVDVFFGMLLFFPPENITVITDMITANFEAIGATMLDQVSVAAVRFEYEVIGFDTDAIQILFILKAGGLMLLMTLLAVICTIAVSYLASRTAAGIARDLRSDVFRKIGSFSGSEFDTFSTASLIYFSTELSLIPHSIICEFSIS
ncbi:MAG: ABC transporter ATP-binding protein, partial [Candidatus Heimdallarchaeota archaeon]|nr:ABC transporter ATP-binding protein [Candidatus Heimdallarchaeota archaeon]